MNGHGGDPFEPMTMKVSEDPVCYLPDCDRPNPMFESGILWIANATISEPKEVSNELMFIPTIVRFCSRQCGERWHRAEDRHAFDNDRKYGFHPELNEKYSSNRFMFSQHDADDGMSSLQMEDFPGSGVEYAFDYPGHPRTPVPDRNDTAIDILIRGVKPQHDPSNPTNGSHWPPLTTAREP